MKEMDMRFPGLFGRVAPGPGLSPKSGAPQWSFESRKYIGIYCNELNRELAEHFGVKEGTALIVSRLTENGPAAKAKMRVGDIVVSVDGKRVETVNGLIDLVQAKAKGAKVKIEGLREGKAVKFEVEVAEEESGGLPESESLQSFLESWQGYTDAFQNELRRLDSERDPLMRQALKGLTLNGRLRRI